MSKKESTLVCFKGFDKDWSCRGFKYEIGKKYVHEGTASLCNSGFHACESPLDIWDYYPPVDGNQAAIVELGETTEQKESDTKRVGKSIIVKAALTIAGLVSAQIEWCQKNADGKAASSGDYSKAASPVSLALAVASKAIKVPLSHLVISTTRNVTALPLRMSVKMVSKKASGIR